MRNVLGGHLVTEVMEKEGITHAFCVPGESYLGVIDGLYQHSTIKLIATRHESGASFMAEAYAKATGTTGVCLATRGPGATNLSIGLHTAMQDSTPLVALIGQVERPFIGKEAFQEVDFKSFFSHLCKWTVEIDDANRIPELLHRAFYVARSGRPGPVAVSLPHDMLEDYVQIAKESTPIHINKTSPDEDIIQTVIHQIHSSKKPILIAGGGVIASKAQKELETFAERLNMPVVTAFRRFNAFSNLHQNYAGWLGFGANPQLLKNIKEADLVVALGTRLSQVTTQDYTLLDANTRLIQIDIAEDSIGKAYHADIGVLSDVKLFLKRALQLLKQNDEPEKINRVKQINNSYINHSTVHFQNSSDRKFADLSQIMHQFIEAVPDHTIITSDAGNFYGWLARYFRFTDTIRYIGPTSGAMGYGLPSAIGAKIACPERTVISFSGDGGFLMTGQEFETASREDVKVIAIVVNNNMYGTIRAHQEKQFPNRVIATPLTNPDFREFAKLYGGNGAVVSAADEFLPAFKKALQSAKSFIIEIRTDPDILSVAQDAEKGVNKWNTY